MVDTQGHMLIYDVTDASHPCELQVEQVSQVLKHTWYQDMYVFVGGQSPPDTTAHHPALHWIASKANHGFVPTPVHLTHSLVTRVVVISGPCSGDSCLQGGRHQLGLALNGQQTIANNSFLTFVPPVLRTNGTVEDGIQPSFIPAQGGTTVQIEAKGDQFFIRELT